MKPFGLYLLIFLLKLTASANLTNSDSIPSIIKGRFTDDYGIKYTINDSLWNQHPDAKYHIIKWNSQEQYLLVRNDANNPSSGNLFTRIDYMEFSNMEPYKWGFCLTVFDATSAQEAEKKASADRKNPKTGCGGFPFSRMKRIK